MDPATTALASAIENSVKVANTPLFTTVIDRVLGFKISEWKAQGDTIRKQILDGYEEAKQKGLGIQYVSAFRSNANLINTSVKAAKYITSEVKETIEIDNDVFWGLLDHSKLISNEEMQELIAKILAGEYNAPGTYSMSTLQVLKMLGKDELKLFENLCSLLINTDQIPQDLFHLPESAKTFMNKLHIDFASLQTLQTLGLFLPNDMTQTIENSSGNNFEIKYFDKGIIYSPITPENKDTLEIQFPGYYGLSLVGLQLLRHINPKENIDYFEWLKQNYKIPNYKLEIRVAPETVNTSE